MQKWNMLKRGTHSRYADMVQRNHYTGKGEGDDSAWYNVDPFSIGYNFFPHRVIRLEFLLLLTEKKVLFFYSSTSVRKSSPNKN